MMIRSSSIALAALIALAPAATATESEQAPQPATVQDIAPPTPALLSSIVVWLTTNFELPASHDHPRVEFATPEKLAAVRYGRLLPGAQQGIVTPGNAATPLQLGHDLLAVYDGTNRIMYLREGWAGRSPAEISVLVHEMVHHLQRLAGVTYPCPAAGEKLAYQAQEKWLAMSGLSLESEFEVDRFTILVRASCMY